MTAKRRPKRRPPALTDPTVAIDGQQLYRIDGIWCASTQAHTWESAAWLRTVTTHQLLDHIHQLEQGTP